MNTSCRIIRTFAFNFTFSNQRYLVSLILLSLSAFCFSQNYEAGDGARAGVGDHNTIVGGGAGDSMSVGNSNSFFGQQAGQANTTGSWNSFFGEDAGYNNTTGYNNSFFGQQVGQANTTGSWNSFFGESAGDRNRTGTGNSFFGRYAGRNNRMGSGNIAIGAGSGPTTDNDNLHMRLYIDVDTLSIDGNDDPLIYGEFDNDFVRINGTFEVTAGLSNPSSRHLKHNFTSLSAPAVLAKLSTLDVPQWSYKHRPDETHIGPVAEDFHALFGLGGSDQHISTIDADGIMMLSIQALKKENDILREQLVGQEQQNLEQDQQLKSQAELIKQQGVLLEELRKYLEAQGGTQKIKLFFSSKS